MRILLKPQLIYLSLVFFILDFASCTLSNREIEDHYWKFAEIRRGNPKQAQRHQIDHIVFAESRYYTLVKDTIYRDDDYPAPYAVIINRQKFPSLAIEIVILGTTDTIRYAGK